MRPLPRTLRASCFAMLLLAATAASARTLTVGADAHCTHHDLAAALDAARDDRRVTVIRVARNARHVLADAPASTRALAIVGGYSHCADETALGTTSIVVASDDARAALARIDHPRVRLEGPPDLVAIDARDRAASP